MSSTDALNRRLAKIEASIPGPRDPQERGVLLLPLKKHLDACQGETCSCKRAQVIDSPWSRIIFFPSGTTEEEQEKLIQS